MLVEKVTFELSSEATQHLRGLKRDLEIHGLPVKQRDIVDYVLKHAKIGPLLKYFSSTFKRRIGKDLLELRAARRAGYRKRNRHVGRRRQQQ